MYRQSLNQSDNQQLFGYFDIKARDFPGKALILLDLLGSHY
jgi:hypothetical protein